MHAIEFDRPRYFTGSVSRLSENSC